MNRIKDVFQSLIGRQPTIRLPGEIAFRADRSSHPEDDAVLALLRSTAPPTMTLKEGNMPMTQRIIQKYIPVLGQPQKLGSGKMFYVIGVGKDGKVYGRTKDIGSRGYDQDAFLIPLFSSVEEANKALEHYNPVPLNFDF